MVPCLPFKDVEKGRISSRITKEELLEHYRFMLLSRLIDDEEIRLRKRNLIYFQVSSAGHEAIGVACASMLKPGYDWFFPYYRDRAMCLKIGMTAEEMMLSAVGSSDDPISGGRQMTAHWGYSRLNIVSQSSPTGTQFSQAVGCAESSAYIRRFNLDLPAEEGEITVACSGEGATSQGEFWEAINTAANKKIPVLFLIEDNEYAISTPVEEATAGGDIGKCFSGVPGLKVLHCDGSDLLDCLDVCEVATAFLREGNGPVLLHAKVTRPYSHSLSDDQVYYRTKDELEEEKKKDCLLRLEQHLLEKKLFNEHELEAVRKELEAEVRRAREAALAAPKPEPETLMNQLFSDYNPADPLPTISGVPRSGGEPITMASAITRTISEEMAADERIRVFGEDVADATRKLALSQCKGKGGVFKVTYGLQREFGSDRVFNTPLAEAAIIGRAIGMAARGLKPVAEIQFFDFIWPAMNQIRSEMATMRWRSNGDTTAPMVVRVAIGGYLRGGAIYHSQTAESIFLSCPGLYVAYPSNAADAMGLMRAALRMDDPVMFFEHKHLYLSSVARSQEPGPDHLIPFGKAAIKRRGNDATIITWGAAVYKALEAAEKIHKKMDFDVEVIDLRTLCPLDRETIMASVRKTGKVLVAHEEPLTAGFGGEIASMIGEECFEWLDAPVKRVASKDCWVAYSPILEEATLLQTKDVSSALEALARY